MTDAQRDLLIALSEFCENTVNPKLAVELRQLREAVMAAPAPLTPRPKYVAIEDAREHCRNVARRFHGRFSEPNGVWQREGDGAIHAALAALGPTPDPDDVAKAGAPGYAYLYCDGCADNKLKRCVRIGADDYSSSNLYCPTCIREAAALLDAIE